MFSSIIYICFLFVLFLSFYFANYEKGDGKSQYMSCVKNKIGKNALLRMSLEFSGIGN